MILPPCIVIFVIYSVTVRVVRVLRPILTITSVWNTGETGDIYKACHCFSRCFKMLILLNFYVVRCYKKA